MIHFRALPTGAGDTRRWRTYIGTYGVESWGRTLELHKVRLKNGALTLNGALLNEVQLGLFFANNGEVLDLRGPTFYMRNNRLEKIAQGTVIFYTLFLSLCGLTCLAMLVWPPVRWIWLKIRREAPAPRPTWTARMSRTFTILAAFVGPVLFAGLMQNPAVVLDGVWLPTPGTPIYVSFAHLSPYLLLGLALVAAVFAGLDWNGRTDKKRWVEMGEIALLAAFALVVI